MAGGFSARLVARLPRTVRASVRQITIVTFLLMTEVPANTTLEAPVGSSGPVAVSLAYLSAG